MPYRTDGHINLHIAPQLLSSAIENILRNAIHYSDYPIQVSVSVKGKYIEWVIEDDGNGIEENHIDKYLKHFTENLLLAIEIVVE